MQAWSLVQILIYDMTMYQLLLWLIGQTYYVHQETLNFYDYDE